MRFYNTKNPLTSMLCIVLSFAVVFGFAPMFDLSAKAAVREVISYEEQTELLGILGIYEHITSDTPADSTVTRAQFAEVAANLSWYAGTEMADAPYYTDVAPDNEYYPYIQHVTKNFVMNGIGGYMFAPDATISEIQALTVMLKLLGYADLAAMQGGYPAGFITMGHRAKLTTAGVGTSDAPITVRSLTELIYNALCAEVVQMLPTGDGMDYNINSGKTMLYDRFGVTVFSGLVTASEQTSLSGAEGAGRGQMAVDNVLYRTSYDANPHIGTRAICFLDEDNPETIIYIAADAEAEILTIESEDIDTFAENKYAYLDGEKEKTASLSLNVKVIFNGRYTPAESLTIADYVPEVGSVKLVDIDNDKLYDVCIITSYEYYVISAIGTSNNTIYDRFGKKPLDMDLTDTEHFVTYSAYGKKIDLEYFKTDDCLEVLVSKDGAVVSATLVTNKYEGEIAEMGESTVVLGSETYELAESLKAPFYDASGALVREAAELGLYARYHISDAGRVVHYETISTAETQYGYMISYMKKGSEFTPIVAFKILTDVDPEIYEPADKVRFVNDDLADMKEYMLKPVELYDALKARGVTRDVVRFSLNAEGKLASLELPKDRSAEPGYIGYSIDCFAKDAHWDSARVYRQKIGAKYSTNSDTKVFTIPVNADSPDGYYSVSTRSVLGDDRKGKITVYGSDENTLAKVLVIYTSGAGGGGGSTSISVVRNAAFVVTDITKAIMDDGEEGYKLTGWQSGSIVTRYSEGDVGTFPDSAWGYTDVCVKDLKPGDIIQYNTSYTGHLANILPLFRIEDSARYTEAIATGLTNTHQLTEFDALDLSHSLYGEVIRTGTQSITVSPRNDLDPAWNRSYLYATQPKVIIFNTKNGTIANATTGDVQPGDKVFLRDYYHDIRELVIFR